MTYVLSKRYALRGWSNRLGGLYDTETKKTRFIDKNYYLLLMKCDAAHDIDVDSLHEYMKEFISDFEKNGIIHKAGFLEFLSPEQEYKQYPAEYKESVHWSITGACNFKCRHCFMSTPHAKHGAPTHEQIIKIADSLAECGIHNVGLTGGEPLICDDFLDIISALSERDILVTTIYTNGWLVDEKLLDEIEKRGQHPAFQLSFDGIGMHDFLRGVPGAEEKAIAAIKLLRKRGIGVSVSMCVHKKNADTLRKTIKMLAELGVSSIKVGSMMSLGEWAQPEVADLQLSSQENLEMIERYIPQYFEDNAPLSIMMSGAFMYTPGDDEWNIYYRRECPAEKEAKAPVCGVLLDNFYIGADGIVAPCMGMCDCGYAVNFPNLFKTPLKEIIGLNSDFNRLCHTTVAETRDKSGKCRDCKYIDRCAGGCRNAAIMTSDNYYAPDEENCYFFENGWEERITAAAQPAFEEYIKRCPPKKKETAEKSKEQVNECP
ncbi:MAG: radical SAM protein [Ruminiclostridium sp.]|nr:radical SAM protein [Ruminiclostridium sp.]